MIDRTNKDGQLSISKSTCRHAYGMREWERERERWVDKTNTFIWLILVFSIFFLNYYYYFFFFINVLASTKHGLTVMRWQLRELLHLWLHWTLAQWNPGCNDRMVKKMIKSCCSPHQWLDYVYFFNNHAILKKWSLQRKQSLLILFFFKYLFYLIFFSVATPSCLEIVSRTWTFQILKL